MGKLPNIALVGNAPREKHEILNSMLAEEDLTDLCSITLYGADGQPEDEAFRDALEDYKNGNVQGIVCLPMSHSLRKMLQHEASVDTAEMLMISMNDKCRIASVTNAKTIGEANGNIRQEDVKQSALSLTKSLKREQSILNPRIAVLSFNEVITADNDSEEVKVIAPVVSELVNEGIQVFGPITMESFLTGNVWQSYDAVLSMYEGQKERLLNTLSDTPTITVVSGLSIPLVTTEAEGVLYAIYAVMDMDRRRTEYDMPFKNPLQKHYHERKEGNDKTRFTVKKKGFNPAEHRRENLNKTQQNEEKKEVEVENKED